jgi:hypothetical protein
VAVEETVSFLTVTVQIFLGIHKHKTVHVIDEASQHFKSKGKLQTPMLVLEADEFYEVVLAADSAVTVFQGKHLNCKWHVYLFDMRYIVIVFIFLYSTGPW